MKHELDPQIFDSMASVQKFCAEGIRNYRSLEAEQLTRIADGYDLDALRAAELIERERLEGIAEGLRVAAARLDVEAVTA